MNWLSIKAKLVAAGGLLLAVLAAVLRMKMLKQQRDKAKDVAETLRARAHVQNVHSQIKREEEKNLHSRRVEILKEIRKEAEEFSGADNLTDPNDF